MLARMEARNLSILILTGLGKGRFRPQVLQGLGKGPLLPLFFDLLDLVLKVFRNDDLVIARHLIGQIKDVGDLTGGRIPLVVKKVGPNRLLGIDFQINRLARRGRAGNLEGPAVVQLGFIDLDGDRLVLAGKGDFLDRRILCPAPRKKGGSSPDRRRSGLKPGVRLPASQKNHKMNKPTTPLFIIVHLPRMDESEAHYPNI